MLVGGLIIETLANYFCRLPTYFCGIFGEKWERLPKEHVQAFSNADEEYGSFLGLDVTMEPLSRADDRDSRKRNRRVEVRILSN